MNMQGKRNSTVRARAMLAVAVMSGAGSVLLTTTGASAAHITWANTGITWNAGANWLGGVAPTNSTTADAAIFVGSPSANPTLSAQASVGALDFQSGGWTFSGSQLTLGTGITGDLVGINSTNNATGVITFNNNFRYSATQTWSQSLDLVFNGLVHADGTSASRSLTLNGTGNITVNGDFDLNSGTGAVPRIITVGGSGTMTINGVVKNTINTGTLRCDTTGMLRLTNTNTYSGGTGISAGILQINSDAALGAVPASVGTANISVTGSSTLQFAAALGTVTLNGNRGIYINGSASTARTLTLDTNDNTIFLSSPLNEQNAGTGTTTIVVGNFTKQGSGTLVMSSANNLTGTTNFAAGTLVAASSTALGNGILRWGGGTLASTAPLTVNNNSVLTNASHIGGDQTISFAGPLLYNGSTDRSESFDQAAGVVTQVNGGLVISSTSGARQFTIGGVGEVNINSVVSETSGNVGTLRITNHGTVTLGSANTYTGQTILDEVDADVNLGNDLAFSTGTIVWNAGSLRSSGAARTLANAIVMNTGTTSNTKLLAGPSDWNLTGNISVAGGGQRVLSVGTFNTATLSGVISDTDGTGFAKAGAGTMVLTNTNTYAGGTGFHNGTMVVGSDANLGAATGSLTFDGGALLTTAGLTSARDIVTGAGGGTFDTGAFDSTFSTAISGTGPLTKEGTGNLTVKNVRLPQLSLHHGTVTIAANGTDSGLSVVGTLAIAGGPGPNRGDVTATLDLVDNDLVTGAPGRDGIASVIRSSRNDGNWNLPGLTSSAARTQTDHATMLGVLSGAEYHSVAGPTATFDGVPVNDTDALVKYTWYGDTDFNGKVNFDDYVRTDNGFNNHLNGWLNGDFDLNGQVNFDDYVLIDLAFNTQSGTLGRALSFADGSDRSLSGMSDPALAKVREHLTEFGEGYAQHLLAAVPEPASLAMAGLIGSVATLSRRRRRTTC
jgi:autotransporter-associated beta strand protein